MSGYRLSTNNGPEHKSLDAINERILLSQARAEQHRMAERARRERMYRRRRLLASILAVMVIVGMLLVFAR